MSRIQELQAINEAWEDRVRRTSREEGWTQGRDDGLRLALAAVYEARFGAMPPALQAGIEAAENAGILAQWVGMFATRTREEIAEAVGAGSDAAAP